MQEFKVSNCYYFYFNEEHKGGKGVAGATITASEDSFRVTDSAGIEVASAQISDIIDCHIEPEPGQRMLGIAKELAVRLQTGLEFMIQPNEESKEYISAYETELVAFCNHILSKQGIVPAPPTQPVQAPTIEAQQVSIPVDNGSDSLIQAGNSRNYKSMISSVIIFVAVVAVLGVLGAIYYSKKDEGVVKNQPQVEITEDKSLSAVRKKAFDESFDDYLNLRKAMHDKDLVAVADFVCDDVDTDLIDLEAFSSISYKGVERSEDEKASDYIGDYMYVSNEFVQSDLPNLVIMDMFLEHTSSENTDYMKVRTNNTYEETCISSILVSDNEDGSGVIASFGI